MSAAATRIAWQNLLAGQGLIVRCSSQQSGLPAAHVINPLRTKPWWSRAGFNIVADWQKLDFLEGATARVATLTLGNYATPALAAAHIEARINAAAVDNTYTFAYSTSTHKNTWARATGVTAFSLPFATGTNHLISPHGMLGWADTDYSGATSYEAPSVSYHSWEWLKVDLGAATAAQFAAVLNDNLSAGGSIRLQANATDAWTAPSVDEAIASLGDDGLIRYKWLSAAQSYRYWRLLIKDHLNSDGYSAIGLAWVGPYVQPTRGIAQAYSEPRSSLSASAYSTHGARFLDVRPQRYDYRLRWGLMPSADKTTLEAVHVGADLRPLILALDAVGAPGRVRYGALSQLGEWTPTPTQSGERWNADWTLEEQIG